MSVRISGIYALIDTDRDLPFYVGCSKHVHRRISQHKQDWNRQAALGISSGVFYLPAYKGRNEMFRYLSLDGREFAWTFLEETDDLKTAEAAHIDMFIKAGVPLCNRAMVYNFGNFQNTPQKPYMTIPCPISIALGYEHRSKSYLGPIRLNAWRVIPTLVHLNRDRPDLARQVRSGEISAHAAAVEAGFRKAPTPLKLLQKAWKAASEEEQVEFLEWIRTNEPKPSRN
jgi:hypothetical protein